MCHFKLDCTMAQAVIVHLVMTEGCAQSQCSLVGFVVDTAIEQLFFPGTLAFSGQYHSTSDPESFICISLRLHNGSNCQCCSTTYKRLHVLKLTLVSFHVNISYHSIFMIIIFKLLWEPKIMAVFQ